MKYFCSKCGKTTLYNFELPKFCSFCGQSFSSPSTQSTKDGQKFLNELKLKKNNQANTRLINEDYIEDVEEEVIPNINFKNIKAKFTVDIRKSQGESFGSLIDNPAAPPIEYDNSELNIKSKDQILEEFKKEAGASRPK
jgi:hypothetical protein